MRAFLIENAATVVVCLLLVVAVAAAIRKMRKNKRAGNTACGCHCGDCSLRLGCTDCKAAADDPQDTGEIGEKTESDREAANISNNRR